MCIRSVLLFLPEARLTKSFNTFTSTMPHFTTNELSKFDYVQPVVSPDGRKL